MFYLTLHLEKETKLQMFTYHMSENQLSQYIKLHEQRPT